MNLTAARTPCAHTQLVFSTTMSYWYGLWAFGSGGLVLLLLFGFDKSLSVGAWTFLVSWKLVLLVLGRPAFDSGPKAVVVRPSAGEWSLYRRRLLWAARVENYCASDVQTIEISSWEAEGIYWRVEVHNRDGLRIDLTGPLTSEDEAENVALALARPLGLEHKIVRLPCV